MSQEDPRPATPAPETIPASATPPSDASGTHIPTLLPESTPVLRTGPPPGEHAALRRLGKFVLLEELGSGGMGTVYKAFQPDLQRVVALKALRGSVAAGSAIQERFQREARSVARLTHPGIVRVYEVGETEGVHYFTMEFIEGEDLGTRLAHEQPPLQERIRWIRDAALAVQHAHECGLVHRDIKPANILVDKAGTVKVADFGLAWDATADRRLTLTGEWMGTPHYMSPEQARGDWNSVGPASDVYSLAATLYDLVAGTPPVDASDVYGILERVTRGQVAPLRAKAPTAPRDLETICSKALELDPRQRYATAKEFAEDLDRLLRLEAIRARPLSFWGRTARTLERNWRRTVVAGVALAVLGTAGAIGYAQLRHRLDGASRIEEEQRRAADAMDQYRLATNPDYLSAHGGVPAQVTLLEQAVAHCPTFAEGHYRLGVVYEETGRIEESTRSYLRAIDLDPQSTRARARIAILRLLRGPFANLNPDWESGQKTLADLEREAPDDPWTVLARAYRDVILGDPSGPSFEEIAARLEKVTDPLPEARLLLAGLYGFYFHPLRPAELNPRRDMRDLDRALREISSFVGQEPLSVIGRMDRALIRYELGDLVQAEADLAFVIDSAPAWAEPPYYLGRVLFTERRYADAERTLRSSIAMVPQASHLNFLAIVQTFRRDFTGALATCDQSLTLAPGDMNAEVMRAIVLHCLGRTQEADEEFGRVADSNVSYVAELRTMDAEMARPEVRLILEVVKQHLMEFQDILFLAPKEKSIVKSTLVGALAMPRLKKLAQQYQGGTALRREVEELVFNLARVEREIPELAAATRAYFRKIGIKSDPETLSILAQFWFKLAHDLDLTQRGALPTLDDCLWRAGTWYRMGQYDRAQSDAEDARGRDRTSAKAYYALATLYAIQGNTARCADELRHARLYGWKNLDFVKDDPDFSKVLDDPEVQKAIQTE